ncbi:CoA transferase [Rhodococcus sp. T2V]|uniref:CaiB/BaiF CoA-transferase family protein n=1 Tax=Rhodococcus sp. T2V TaxID=3034164 RepID=UPI0023E24051|nr:CoA transferase [Rhodococcus sp. T2V]MDF3312199.1 CoA transferase [Rhodococcus sp. T2V]
MTNYHCDYDPPLSGVNVLDLSTGPMLEVGRLLADLGAVCTRADVRGINDDRDGRAGSRLDHLAELINRHGIAEVEVDRGSDEGVAEWDALLANADILIESTRPGSEAAAVLNVAALRARLPQLVVLSISDFGATTSYREWQATTPVLHALTSELSRSGIPGRDPLIPPGELPYNVAAAQAAMSVIAVYLHSLRSVQGEHIDFSILDGAMQSLDPPFGIASSASAGIPLTQLPRERPEERHRYPIIPCADGYVRICVLAKRQWRGLWKWMGSPAEFADPKYDTTLERRANPKLIPAINRFMVDKTRAELERQGQRHGVPTAAVLSLDEVLESDHLAARGFLREVELAPDVVAPAPNGLLEIDGHRASLSVATPSTTPAPQSAPILGRRARTRGDLPLEGIKVLDLGVIVVGGDSARLFGDLGAEVIKIENSSFPDGLRVAFSGPMVQGFAAGHRNKRSFGVDLRQPEGVSLVKQLVADADVVLANFKPGVLDSLGLEEATLRGLNPGLVLVESSAFGPTGPWAERLGYGPLVRAAAGLTDRWIYPDEPGTFSDAITTYPDHVAARIGVLGALALLIRRERTGTGGSASVAQFEVMLSHMAAQIAATALERRGQSFGEVPEHDAPWGVFETAGDDDWVAITVRNDAEWCALCQTIDRADLLVLPELATRDGRDRNRIAVDAAIREWTSRRSAAEAMTILQESGIPAGKMLRAADVPEWSYYTERGVLRRERYPFGQEPYLMENTQIAGSGVADPPFNRAPLLGEHTREIALEELRLGPAEVDDLFDRRVLEAAPNQWLALLHEGRADAADNVSAT